MNIDIKSTMIKYVAAVFLLLYFSFVGYNIGKDLVIKQQGVEITDF